MPRPGFELELSTSFTSMISKNIICPVSEYPNCELCGASLRRSRSLLLNIFLNFLIDSGSFLPVEGNFTPGGLVIAFLSKTNNFQTDLCVPLDQSGPGSNASYDSDLPNASYDSDLHLSLEILYSLLYQE